jgi:hypothetical protein
LVQYVEDLPFRGRGQPAATTPEQKRDIPTVSPAGIHGATRKIVFDGIRELLMSL